MQLKLKNIIHNIKSPLHGLIGNLNHLEAMLKRKEDIQRVCDVIERTSEEINQRIKKLKEILDSKEVLDSK